MKKEIKLSIITFIVVALIAYIAFCFVPDSALEHAMANGSIFTMLGNSVVQVIGMRVIISLTFALIVTLLIRIVDNEETGAKKSQTKTVKTTKKETK